MSNVEKTANSSATSKSNSRTGIPSQSELEAAIGAKVRLSTVATPSTTLEGVLFTADPIYNVIALQLPPASASGSGDVSADTNPKSHYRIIPMPNIASLEILPRGSSATNATASTPTTLPVISPADTKALKAREDSRVRELQELKRRTGVNVSADAQALFDALHRIYPTVWRGQDIQVSNAVIISPPYEKCVPFPGKESTLPRFQMIVDGERKKLSKRSNTAAT